MRLSGLTRRKWHPQSNHKLHRIFPSTLISILDFDHSKRGSVFLILNKFLYKILYRFGQISGPCTKPSQMGT